MPDLEVQIAGGSMSGMTVDWSLDAASEQADRGTKDNLHVPQVGDTIRLPIDQTWRISDYYLAGSFFGGKCVINYQIKDFHGNNLTPVLKYPFLIRGRNPVDNDALAYLIANKGNYDYLWAIARHESRTPSGYVYNQFACSNGSSWGNLGQPFHSDTEGKGYGICQRDDKTGGATVTASQVYNWQGNVLSTVTELGAKWSVADRFYM